MDSQGGGSNGITGGLGGGLGGRWGASPGRSHLPPPRRVTQTTTAGACDTHPAPRSAPRPLSTAALTTPGTAGTAGTAGSAAGSGSAKRSVDGGTQTDLSAVTTPLLPSPTSELPWGSRSEKWSVGSRQVGTGMGMGGSPPVPIVDGDYGEEDEIDESTLSKKALLQRQLKRKIAELDRVLRAFGPDGDGDAAPAVISEPFSRRLGGGGSSGGSSSGGGGCEDGDDVFSAQISARETLRQKLDAARRRAALRGGGRLGGGGMWVRERGGGEAGTTRPPGE